MYKSKTRHSEEEDEETTRRRRSRALSSKDNDYGERNYRRKM